MAKSSEGRTEARPNQSLPSNWTPNGLSTGKATGAVRPTKDACNDTRKGSGKRG